MKLYQIIISLTQIDTFIQIYFININKNEQYITIKYNNVEFCICWLFFKKNIEFDGIMVSSLPSNL